MKIGTQTGSVVNHLYSRAVIGQPEPVVGMAATLLSWTDRYASTVVDVFAVGKSLYVTVQDDTAKVVKGSTHNGSAEYEYCANPDGGKTTFKQGSDGRWVQVRKNPDTGRWVKSGGGGLRIGHRDEYRDPSF